MTSDILLEVNKKFAALLTVVFGSVFAYNGSFFAYSLLWFIVLPGFLAIVEVLLLTVGKFCPSTRTAIWRKNDYKTGENNAKTTNRTNFTGRHPPPVAAWRWNHLSLWRFFPMFWSDSWCNLRPIPVMRPVVVSLPSYNLGRRSNGQIATNVQSLPPSLSPASQEKSEIGSIHTTAGGKDLVTEKVPQRNCVTKSLPNIWVNFLVRFASKPLFYWVMTGNPSNCSENSLVLFVRFFGFVGPFWLLKDCHGHFDTPLIASGVKINNKKFKLHTKFSWNEFGQSSWSHCIRGQKLNTNVFSLKLFGHPRDILAEILGYPAKKVWFPWVSKNMPNFWAPTPRHTEDAHPTRRYPDQKVWVWVPFSSLIYTEIIS